MMRILLADDDSSVRRVLQFKLQKKGFRVTTAEDGQQALDHLSQNRYDLLLSDIRMPKVGGITLLDRARSIQPDLKVVLITAHATISQAVQAVKLGAFDYITKPFDDEVLLLSIDKALQFKKLEKENKHLKGQLKRQQVLKKIIGVSRPFKEMMELVKKISATEVTVLLSGESGTGKELIARTIHSESSRRDKEFVALNCAAIPRELIESELFGHVKGAFTGAVRDKKGKFELADEGTLLLDEISEIAIELQAKLLRVLQERTVDPVGSEQQREVDVRVIAATNVDIKKKVIDGLFREDLFYRLNVIPIRVPSLRERIEDIPLLAKEFLNKLAENEEIVLSKRLMDSLMNYKWPGNVRELENLIERMIILRHSNELDLKDLPADFGSFDPHTKTAAPEKPKVSMGLIDIEKKFIVEALEKCGWNKTKAAKYLDIPRHVLIYRLKKFDISEAESAQSAN